MCHTKGEDAYTLEGQIIRIADKIAYINHDIDDAIRAGVMTEEDIPLDLRIKLGMSKSERINNMVLNVINNSNDEKILMSNEYWRLFNDLHDFMFVAVYKNPVCKSEETKAIAMIEKLYDYYSKKPEEMPNEFISIAENEGVDRAVCDYIAGMSDNYSVKIFNQLFVPMFWIE